MDLADIVATSALQSRPRREPDHRAENAALVALAEGLTESPGSIAQRLVESALALTGGGSSGLSLEETVNGKEVFRWVATAGDVARYANRTMPRKFSPCGSVVDSDRPMLLQEPARVFPYVNDFGLPLLEVLLVPFRRGTTAIGTVWVISHSDAKRFDAEDLRVVESLASFAGAASQQQQAMQALEEADRQKDVFLATLAHELRNPLAPIGHAALIAAAPTATEEQRRWSQGVIERQVRNMASLLDDLLDASRVSRGRLELRKEPIDLASVVGAAVETARPLIEAKSLELTVELRPPAIGLIADPLRLSQILSNLLTNAAKYTDPGGKVAITAEAGAADVIVRIRDTGIGLEPDSLTRIFEMFTQIKPALDRPEGGLGIGLALAKGLAELHGGTLSVSSPGLGRGSEFALTLPRGCPTLAISDAIAIPAQADQHRAVKF